MCTFFLCQEFNPTQTAVHSTKTLPPINHRGRSWPRPSDFGLNHPLRLTGQRKGMGGGAGLGLGLLRRWERHSTRPPKQQQMQDQGPTSLLWEGGGCNKAGWCTKSIPFASLQQGSKEPDLTLSGTSSCLPAQKHSGSFCTPPLLSPALPALSL